LFPDDIPDEVKRRRNNDLLAVQNAISEELNQPLIGRVVDVLVEGPSKHAERQTHDDHGYVGQEHGHGENGHGHHHALQLTGRTPCDRIVVFDGNPRQIGQIMPVRIYDASSFTLFGAVVTEHVGPEVFQVATPGKRRV
jgi:tRNA-2-methylthio-N6-dimethylallyladenosine synthase